MEIWPHNNRSISIHIDDPKNGWICNLHVVVTDPTNDYMYSRFNMAKCKIIIMDIHKSITELKIGKFWFNKSNVRS